MSDFEYRGIFDHLEPEDFLRASSAVDDRPGTYVGADRFTQFIHEQLHAVRVGFTASDGQLNPVGVLASRTIQRVFVPDDDETLGDFLNRIQREGKLIGAHWFFFSMLTRGATMPATEEEVDEAPAADSEEMQIRLAMQMEEVIMWYAEAIGDHVEARAGLIPIDGVKLESTVGREVHQPIRNLRYILNG